MNVGRKRHLWDHTQLESYPHTAIYNIIPIVLDRTTTHIYSHTHQYNYEYIRSGSDSITPERRERMATQDGY